METILKNTTKKEQKLTYIKTKIKQMNEKSKDIAKIGQMLNEIEKCKTKEEEENQFIGILEYVYQSNFCKNNEKFEEELYDKIIEFYYDAMASDKFKQNLEHYINNIFMINISNVKISDNHN